jgi:probable rRNA maturation factor
MDERGEGDAELEIELIGTNDEELRAAAQATLDRLGVRVGHVAIEIVVSERMHELNLDHRGIDSPTDVLSFPVDGEGVAVTGPPPPRLDGPLELGDVVICPEHTEDMVEATVHGILHLCGYDHEHDDGTMLDLQDEIVDGLES